MGNERESFKDSGCAEEKIPGAEATRSLLIEVLLVLVW